MGNVLPFRKQGAYLLRMPVLDVEAFAAALPYGAPVLGLDLGEKTIGIAVSDATRTVASPLTLIRKTKFTDDVAAIVALMKTRKVAGLVIGLPVNMDGTEGPRAQATRAFARNLSRLTEIPIALWDERLSTAAAERFLISADVSRARRAKVIDQHAATFILDGALTRLGGLAGAR